MITELLNDKGDHAIKPSEIIAIVRKPEIAAKMKKLGIAVSDVSLTDEAGIEALVLETGGESLQASIRCSERYLS